MDLLGLSFDIDAAASLVRDGRVVAAAAEERFTRVKHDRDFPEQALRFCLESAATRIEDVDRVAMAWNPTIHLEPLLWRRSSRVRHHSEYLAAVPNLLMRQYREVPAGHVTEQVHHFGAGAPPLRVDYVDHHLCHAAWAFASPFDRAAVLTIDGFGEKTTTLLARCEGNRLQEFHRVRRPHSLGSLYAAVTQHLGFRPNCDEGIVMSLAALGEPRFADDLRRIVRPRDGGGYELDLAYFAFFQESTQRVSPRFVERFGPHRAPGDPLDDRHRDLAASLQVVFEEIYLHLLEHLHRVSGCDDLVVAGGAALNCVANGLILGRTGFERLFIPPAAGDDGAAAGAALYVHCEHLGNDRADAPFDSAYLGPDCDNGEVDDLLQLSRRTCWRPGSARVPEVAARLLADGWVIGWYQGRAEFGPRALGHRSILAHPGQAATRDHINDSIKFRQPYRPLAPAVLVERSGDLFDRAEPSPYMLRAYTVRPEWRDRLAAAIHVDDSARVQTVSETSPRFRALLERFDQLTGVPAVVNTSLNVRGQPIANTPMDALACFDSTALDALVLGDAIVAKRDREARLAILVDEVAP